MPKFTQFPCTEGACDYYAYSQGAVDSHAASIHGGVAPAIPPPASVVGGDLGRLRDAIVNPTVGREAVAPAPVDEIREVTEASQPHPALAVPAPDDAFWVDNKILRLLIAIESRATSGEVVNIFLSGPTGTGKSTLPEQFAALNDRMCFVQHCELVTEPGDWWGQKEMSVERGTYFEQAAFVDAIRTPGCVIVMDELNRTHPDNLNPLFGLLDHRRQAWVPFMNELVKVSEGVTFWFTMNQGYDYQVSPVDLALMNRAQITIPMRYPPRVWEINILKEKGGVDQDIAEKLTDFARTVRNNPRLHIPISPRQLIEAAKMTTYGIPIHDSVMYTTVNGATEDVDKTALLQALQTVGPVGDAYVNDIEEE